MIDSVLRSYKIYARCYIDDIIIFFKIFKNYIEYLDKIFNLFDTLNIILKGLKVYLGYLLIILLGQLVDGLGIFYLKNRITAILNFEFPTILKEFKKYLSLTD
jgi:hypothetical protein